MGRKLANNGVERHKNSAREAPSYPLPRLPLCPPLRSPILFRLFRQLRSLVPGYFYFYVRISELLCRICLCQVFNYYCTKKRTKTNKINSALLSFSTKQQFYNINMARYRVSQKFVPLISCTIIFDQNLFLHEISRRCLFLYREHMLRISVTDMPFLFCFVLFFFITFCSRCGMVWDTACRLTDDPFWAFLSPGK